VPILRRATSQDKKTYDYGMRSKYAGVIILLFSPAAVWAASPIADTYAKIPLAFERQGEGDEAIYVAHGNGYKISLRGGSATIATSSEVSMDFAGARRAAGVPGRELAGKVNYVWGTDPKRWQLGLSTYESVRYPEIYPGIDVIYRGNQRQMEFDLVLKPQADANRIRLHFRGAENVTVDADGVLVVHGAAGKLRIPPPVVYQEAGGARRSVAAQYRLLRHSEIGFQLGAYDRDSPLAIDPTVVYSTLIVGGTGGTTSYAIAVDSGGNAYIAGSTSAADFPAVNAAFPQLRLSGTAFVSKLDPTGTTLLYSTYINGMGNGTLQSIAVDSTGAAWVAGWTTSTEFPLMNAYQSTYNTAPAAVVLKLGATGALLYSSYLGSNVYGYGIAVDPNGNAYLTGWGLDPTVPVTAGAYLTTQPNSQLEPIAYVTKFNASGGVVYSTYLGGKTNASAIAVDSAGNAYVTGTAYPGSFPNVPPGGAQPSIAGVSNAFVVKLNATGSALVYLTFLGGSQNDSGNAVAVDSNGNAYIAGSTTSPNFPVTTGAYPAGFGGGTDGFIAKLNAAGSSFEYVTYLGGNRVESVTGVAIDQNGNAYVTGQTDSANFPTVSPIDGGLVGNPTSLYQTTNDGSSWSAFDGTIPGAVTSVTPDPSTPGAIVAATEAGFFRSADGGQSWKQTSTLTNAYLSRSPANPSGIYEIDSFTSRNISMDGGQTWGLLGQCCSMDSYNFQTATEIVADGANANTAYIWGPGYSGVERTTTFGSPITLGGSLLSGAQTVVTGSDGSLYADSPLGVYKSTSQGLSSTAVNTGLPSGFPLTVPNGLAISASNPQVLYKALGNQVYVTTNGGGSWVLAGSAPVPLERSQCRPPIPPLSMRRRLAPRQRFTFPRMAAPPGVRQAPAWAWRVYLRLFPTLSTGRQHSLWRLSSR
jgi:hypothetical protein